MLPPSPTESLLSWLDRLDGELIHARRSRPRDLRKEAMLAEAQRAARQQLEDMRSARRKRWREAATVFSRDDEGVKFDSFFREMDAALGKKRPGDDGHLTHKRPRMAVLANEP